MAYAPDTVVAIIDRELAGKRSRDVLPHVAADVPIVADVAAAQAFAPTALLIGVAPSGGALPLHWRRDILQALAAGLDVHSGLHELLVDDTEFVAAARARGVRLIDLRVPPPVPLFSGEAYRIRTPIILTVGSDCAVGKMTVSLELVRAARDRACNATFVPTGQTGIAIAGWGIAIDRVIADFAPGAVERLVVQAAHAGSDLIVVEGQGGINHPAYAPVTLALLYGSGADALVLVHDLARTHIDGYGTPILPYRTLIGLYEGLCATVKPAAVVGIALNTRTLDEDAARRAIDDARAQTGLPADDVVRFGPHALYDAIAPRLAKTEARA